MFRPCLMTSTKNFILWAADINSAFIIFNEKHYQYFARDFKPQFLTI